MNISWLWTNWHALGPTPWVDIASAITAAACGVLVGTERQRREKPAGLRTLTLVCLGSATFTMISFAFTSTTGDSGRVAAQIVTGIGFLGAGVILHGKRTITGMTTAATIWMTAAIGMVAGAGYGLSALLLSVFVNLLLSAFFIYETRWHPDLQRATVVLGFTPDGGLTRIRLERILVEYNLPDVEPDWAREGQLTLHLTMAKLHRYELLSDLADVPGVVSIDQHAKPVPQNSPA